MDSSAVLRSEYLQNRLREKKTATMTANTRPTRLGPEDDKFSRSLNSGRDDGIFDLDEARLKRKAPPSCAAGPSSWRFEDRESAHSRRASGMSVNSGGSAPRTMGVREMEEHVDKLSKQNFDLKLEVFHRREQNEELEKKLQDLPRLEEDHAELLEMNEELVLELERRDHAVDEAVVIICNLEERIRALEEQLVDTRPTTAQHDTPDQTTSDAQSSRVETRPVKAQDTPMSMMSKEPRISGVSPHVSARLAELATPTGEEQREEKRLSRLPSFLNTDEPATNNLRNLFVDGNTVIRPIPSYATLMTRNDGKEEDTYDLPNSPRLSTLSESEFKSIYGKEEPAEPVDIPPVPRLPDFVASQPRNDGDIARESREARTNRWVADAAVLPVKVNKAHRPSSPDVSQFQSLGDVLHQDRGGAIVGPATSSKRKPAAFKESSRKEYTPPISDLPVFGQNVFPPTPDTMMTRPSNQSSTSIVQDKSFNDSSAPPARGHSSLIPMMQNTQLDGSRPHIGFASGVASASKDFSAAYGHAYSRPEPDYRYANNDFGVSLFRRDDYEDFSDFMTPKNSSRQPVAWRTAMDDESMFGSSPPQGSPSSPRYFGNRRLSLEAMVQPHVTRRRPSDQLLRLSSELRNGGSASCSSQDGLVVTQDAHSKPVSHNPMSSRAPKTPVKSEAAIVESPQETIVSNELSPGAELSPTDPLIRAGNSSLSNRAASLRRRMNKFTRRTIGSTNTPASATESTPGKAGRSNSITKHFKGLRRGSNSHTDLEEVNRASMFVEAAQAAAPSLSYDAKDLPALPLSSPIHQPKTSSSTGSRFDDRVSRSGHSNVSSDSASMRNKAVMPASSAGSGTVNSNIVSNQLAPTEQRQLSTIPRMTSKLYSNTSYTAMVGAAAAAVSSSQYNARGRQMDFTSPSLALRQNHSVNRNGPNIQ